MYLMSIRYDKHTSDKGPFKKCVMPEGGGCQMGMTKCDGRGSVAVSDVTPVKIYITRF